MAHANLRGPYVLRTHLWVLHPQYLRGCYVFIRQILRGLKKHQLTIDRSPFVQLVAIRNLFANIALMHR